MSFFSKGRRPDDGVEEDRKLFNFTQLHVVWANQKPAVLSICSWLFKGHECCV